MNALQMIMFYELFDGMSNTALAEQDQLVETLSFYRPDKRLGVRVDDESLHACVRGAGIRRGGGVAGH